MDSDSEEYLESNNSYRKSTPFSLKLDQSPTPTHASPVVLYNSPKPPAFQKNSAVKPVVVQNNSPHFLDSQKKANSLAPRNPTQDKNPELNQNIFISQLISDNPKNPLEKNTIPKMRTFSCNRNPNNSLMLDIPKNPINLQIKKSAPKTANSKSSNLVQLLAAFIDYNKLQKSFYHFTNILNENFIKSQENLSSLQSYLSKTCEICSASSSESTFLVQLPCSNIFCSSCTQKLFKSYTRLCCPKCKKQFTSQEEIQIMSLLGYSKDSFEHSKFLSLLKSNLGVPKEKRNKIQCQVCQKKKYNFDLKSCLHACFECTAKLARDGLFTCPVCATPWDEEKLNKLQVKCTGCERMGIVQSFKFIKIFGKYLHDEKCLLCLECCFSSIVKNRCLTCMEILKKSELIELNDHIFVICLGCKKEVFRGITELRVCCNKRICNTCVEAEKCLGCC